MISRVTHPSGHVVAVSRGEGLGALWLRAAIWQSSAQLWAIQHSRRALNEGFPLPREDSSHLGQH
jgi:hypothetical protein